MFKKIAKKGLFFLVIVFLTSTIYSCKKESPTIGIIVVQNESGNSVGGALVEAYPDSSSTTDIGQSPITEMYKQGTTDSNGRKEFEFPYEARLKVRVTKTVGNNDLKAINYINLRKSKKETKIIQLY